MTSRKDMKELQRVLREEQCTAAGYVGSANSDNQGAFDKRDSCAIEVDDDQDR